VTARRARERGTLAEEFEGPPGRQRGSGAGKGARRGGVGGTGAANVETAVGKIENEEGRRGGQDIWGTFSLGCWIEPGLKINPLVLGVATTEIKGSLVPDRGATGD
jgi:hypothetical protein